MQANQNQKAIDDEETYKNTMINVLVQAETPQILGIHMIGPRIADIIGEAALALHYNASAVGGANIVHGHPTFYESLKEACLEATGKKAIHF